MKDLELKQNVLQEIMDLMDQREGEDLKKHPKLMAAKIEVEKPEDETQGEIEGGETEKSGEISPEDLAKLIEHFKGL